MLLNLTFLAFVAFTPAFALPSSPQSSFQNWSPAGTDDARGPCPMLNALANDGFLPHSGKDISQELVLTALKIAVNFDPTLGQFLYEKALLTNPTPNATTFSLSDLSRHNILEHDASLSRQDYYFGNPQPFSQAIFSETTSYWTADVVDINMVAKARQARIDTSNKTNPTFTLSDRGSAFSLGENAPFFLVLGDRVSATFEKHWVVYLFENERLPLELGWSPRDGAVTLDILEGMGDRIVNATAAE